MVTALVVNASPLIGLGKIDGLWLLKKTFYEVYVPEPVVSEVALSLPPLAPPSRSPALTLSYR